MARRDGIFERLDRETLFARERTKCKVFCPRLYAPDTRVKWMSDVKFTIYNGREYIGTIPIIRQHTVTRRPLSIHIERNWDPIISEFINLSQTRNARHRFIVRFDESKDRSIRMNDGGRRRKKDGRSRWFRTAATLYSTRFHKRRSERHGRVAVDCSKLHQRRDNRVVDCVDRYSIFAELVCHSADNQSHRKIQLSLPTVPPARSVIGLQICSSR